MKKTILIGLLISSQLLSGKSLSFQHHDWQVVCDNTHLCRIAGYSSDSAKLRVSVLLTREAGQRKETKAELQLAWADELFKKLPTHYKLTMLINGKSYGSIAMKNSDSIGKLSKKQTKALISSLSKESEIVWKYGKYQWRLSDEGASAVLLKADEFQQRLNTPTAFYRKGNQSEKNVLKPKKVPIIYVEPIVDDKEIIITDKLYIKELRAQLRSKEEYCFDADYQEEKKLQFYNLNSSKMMVTKVAQEGGYNMAYCSWVVNKKRPFKPQGSVYGELYVDKKHIGHVSNSQKGRGIGDCWTHERYVWTGEKLEESSVGSTGLCRNIAAGGAWRLPTFVSKVKVK